MFLLLLKKLPRSFSLFLFSLVLSLPLSAQNENIKFNHLTQEDGLSQSTVTAILQDSEGFMWYGTKDGLNRYNGYEVTVYQSDPEDSTSLSGSHILTLFEDSRDNLWVGTSGKGINIYNKDDDQFTRIRANHIDHEQSISDDTINAMLEDNEGKIWIGTSIGLNWYLPEEEQFIHFYSDSYFPDSVNVNSISNNTITSLEEDSLGNIWVGTENGLNKWIPEKNKFKRFLHDPSDPNSISNNFIWDIYIDSSGNLWIGTKGGGLNYYNPREENFTHYTTDAEDPFSISDNSINKIFEDSRGVLWIGGENHGLNIFDRESEQFSLFEYDAGNPESISNNSIHSLYESKDQILWIGTFSGGVNYLDRKEPNFEHYSHVAFKSHPLSHNSVSIFLEDLDNNFWVGTDGGGLNLFDRKNKTFKSFQHQPDNPNSPASDVILDILEDHNQQLWLGYYAGGISKFDPETNSYIHFTSDANKPQSLSNNDVFVLHEDRNNNLWVGTNGGDLNLYQPETETFKQFTTHMDIRSLYDDSDGNMWVGSYGGGLIRLNPETEEIKQYATHNSGIANDMILAIHAVNDDVFWLATTSGLIKFNRLSEEFTQFTTSDGLPSMVINGILEDDYRNLWLSTNNGLSRFKPETGRVKNFGNADGLQGAEFKPLSYYKDDEGYLYFGGINGFNRFHPKNLQLSQKVAPVKITGFQIFNQPVSVGKDSPLKKQISRAEKIDLSHSASVFTFQFTALNFDRIKGDQFAYKMEGFDQDWNYVGEQRTATYTNLNPGEYRFRVKVANRSGVWSDEEASVAVTIAPPFWQTSWFYLIIFIFIVGTLITGYRYRVRKIRQQNQHLEREITRRTIDLKKALEELKETRDELVEKAHKAGMAEIAAGVLHNVGNVLNSVNVSTTLIDYTVRNSKVSGLVKANSLLRENMDQLETFICENPRGKQLMEYYLKLEEPVINEQEKVLFQVDRLMNKIELINEVISAQQSYAGGSIHADKMSLSKMIDDALALQSGSIERHQLNIKKDLKATDSIVAQRSKLIHVLVNLIKNAKESMEENHPKDKNLTITSWQDDKWVYMSIADNGSGINKQNLNKIFTHSFTTKRNGHGFGLHSCANYMSEMKGKIDVHSEGEGKGTTFTLIFPKSNKSS